MIGENLLRYQSAQKYLVLDVETEGLNTYFARPWQAALGIVDYKGNIIGQAKDIYIWWEDLNISKEAAAVTRFDCEHYKKHAIPPEEALKIIEEAILNETYKVLFQNGLGYDIMILEVFRREVFKKNPSYGPYEPLYSRYLTRCIDTLALARAFRKGIAPDISSPEAFLAWQFKMLDMKGDRKMKCSLGALAKEFNVKHDENVLHNAAVDIQVTGGVFANLIWKVEV